MAKILIAGCGYTGCALALRLLKEDHLVWGLRRNPDGLPVHVRPFRADLHDLDSLRPLPDYFDYVFYTAGAEDHSETAYRQTYIDGLWNLLEVLEVEGRRPERIFFTSSTAVYAQNGGEWLDETSPTEPQRFNGQYLLEAEALLRGSMFPSTVLRLGGIYGPGRTRLIDQVREGEAYCVEGRNTYLNLIHRDDCAGMLHHLMHLDAPEPLYLGVDHQPVEKNALLRWIAGRLGVAPPRSVPAEKAPQPSRGGNRRFLNTRIKTSGYEFMYPTVYQGYGAELL